MVQELNRQRKDRINFRKEEKPTIQRSSSSWSSTCIKLLYSRSRSLCTYISFPCILLLGSNISISILERAIYRQVAIEYSEWGGWMHLIQWEWEAHFHFICACIEAQLGVRGVRAEGLSSFFSHSSVPSWGSKWGGGVPIQFSDEFQQIFRT
jgi:hypothetical protein